MPQAASDTHCFTVATGGRLVMDVHAVRDASGQIVYQGVSVYTPSPDGKVALSYSNSFGDVMPGTVTRDGDQLNFVMRVQDRPVTVSWTVKGDGYDVAGGPSDTHFSRVSVAAVPVP